MFKFLDDYTDTSNPLSPLSPLNPNGIIPAYR